MDASHPQSFTDKLGKTFTRASKQSKDAESMAPNFEFSFSTSWDSDNHWPQDVGEQPPLPTESTSDSRHEHRGGGAAAAPSGRRIGQREAERRYKEKVGPDCSSLLFT